MLDQYLKILVMTVFISTVAVSCQVKSVQDKIDDLFRLMIKSENELQQVDKAEVDYIELVCVSNEPVKLSTSEELFHSIDSWKEKRAAVKLKYHPLDFNPNAVYQLEIKDERVISLLKELKKELQEAQSLADTDFIDDIDCNRQYIQAKEDYKIPETSLVCIIPCDKFLNLRQQIENLTLIEKDLINSYYNRINNVLNGTPQ